MLEKVLECKDFVVAAWKHVVAVWRSGSALVLINEVNLRRARLVLGWVTACLVSTPGGDTLLRYVTSNPGRLSLLPSVGR